MIFRFMAEETFYTMFSVKARTEEEARGIAVRYMDTPDGQASIDDGYDGMEINVIDTCQDDEDVFICDPLITEEDV